MNKKRKTSPDVKLGDRSGRGPTDKQEERNEPLRGRLQDSLAVPSLSARKMKVRREVTTSNLLSPCPRTCLMALTRIRPLEYIS